MDALLAALADPARLATSRMEVPAQPRSRNSSVAAESTFSRLARAASRRPEASYLRVPASVMGGH